MPAQILPTNINLQTDVIQQKLQAYVQKRSNFNDSSLPELQSLVNQIIISLKQAEVSLNQTNTQVNYIS